MKNSVSTLQEKYKSTFTIVHRTEIYNIRKQCPGRK